MDDVDNDFGDVLALCLNDIESGRATVEQCLARYPGQSAELRPLLVTAQAVRSAPAVEPALAFQSAAQTRLLNLIAARRPAAAPQRSRLPLSPAFHRLATVAARVAVAVALASALLAGTAYAAQDSLPDSPLYPVKRTVEQVRVTAARNDLPRARVFAGLLDERARETATMAAKGKLERSRESGAQYARLLMEAQVLANRVPLNRPEGQKLLTYMRERLVQQQAVLQRGLNDAPETGRLQIRMLILANQRLIEHIDQRLPATITS